MNLNEEERRLLRVLHKRGGSGTISGNKNRSVFDRLKREGLVTAHAISMDSVAYVLTEKGTIEATRRVSKLDGIDLDQQADALWHGDPTDETRMVPSLARTFEKLRDAIMFVMETIEPKRRGTAWITLDQDPGSLSIDDIEILYHRIKGSSR